MIQGVLTTVPAGSVLPYAGSSAPAGFLMCDGSAQPRSKYPELFAAIGTRYGAGDGKTTFNLPDMRGRMALGASGSHALASEGGAESHKHSNPSTGGSGQLKAASAGAHEHSVSGKAASAGSHTHSTTSAGSHSHTAQWAGSHSHGLGSGYVKWTFTGGAIYFQYRNTETWSANYGVSTGHGGTGGNWGITEGVNLGGSTDSGGGHSHSTDTQGSHSHTANSAGAHEHDVSGKAASAGGHEHVIASHEHAMGDTSEASSMPPYLALGYIICTGRSA